ncbi:hypothetical protein BN863_1520 [Formosa agariphila KMM 3901]|uniref:Uncharacterized protein n=1 Tax=Formosa agariphila (strain DSM 15362 / KCTC 12365 / LMG 23005 / KMM 3901 / M-2Alg 35-1) TaxID=1347342 RepID=T2KIR3_FORAG|nr:hypothetical protein [Formosa agariphila]CDF77864.1 hypothetical protein BN863_1520 [Formosa agariphila KMM 3901]
MKIFSIILSVIAIALIIFNSTQIDFNNPFGDESIVALITIMALLCAIVLLLILNTSKSIENKLKNRK